MPDSRGAETRRRRSRSSRRPRSEYDHYANRLLAGGAGDVYETIVKKTGFVRSFYATLKSGTRSGALGRMFITGVSPLMLDDLSSGFNIATHASMSPRLNTLAAARPALRPWRHGRSRG